MSDKHEGYDDIIQSSIEEIKEQKIIKASKQIPEEAFSKKFFYSKFNLCIFTLILVNLLYAGYVSVTGPNYSKGMLEKSNDEYSNVYQDSEIKEVITDMMPEIKDVGHNHIFDLMQQVSDEGGESDCQLDPADIRYQGNGGVWVCE